MQLYTPVNEMYVCAIFSARYGWWNEQLHSERAFVTALKNIVRANVLAMQAILDERPDAIFIQSESSEYYHAENPRAIKPAEIMNGAFYFIKQAFLRMKPGGAIVDVSSIHAVDTEPLVAPYAAAKTVLLSLTRSAALEGNLKGIRVNAILPGAVDTPMLWNNPNVKSGAEKVNQADVGKPEDTAAVIAFLASDDAKFVQGAAVRVDGGRLDRL